MRMRRDTVFSAAILLIIVVWFFDVFFLGRGFFLRDLTTYHFPMKSVVRETILRGEFPAWNALNGGGQPMAANPAYEVFYPPQLLILFPDFAFGYQLHILVHFLIASLGMYAFLRSLGAREWASLIGALSFSLGGAMASTVNVLPFLFSLAWTPLILLFARRFILNRRGTDLLLTSLLIGIQALVGEPVVGLQTYALLGAGALYYGWNGSKKRWASAGSHLLLAILAVACGLAVAAVQLVPAIDHAGQTVRVRGMSFELVSMWSLPAARLVELAFPAFFRNITSNDTTALAAFYPSGTPFLGDLYAGGIIAVAAIAGFFSSMRHRWAVLLLTAALFLVALGSNTPLLRALYEMHLFRSIRYPEKFALGMSLVIITWGSVVLDRFLRSLEDAKEKRPPFERWLWIWGAAAIVLTLLFASSGTTGTQKTGWILLALRGVVALLLSFVIIRRFPRAVPATLVGLLLCDLFYLQAAQLPRMPREFFNPPPAAAQLPRGSGYRIFHAADWQWIDVNPDAEAYFADPATYWWMIRNGGFPRVPWAWGHGLALVEDIDRTDLLPSVDLFQSLMDVRERRYPDWQEVFSSMANVQYRAQLRNFDQERTRAGGDLRQAQPVDFVATTPAPRFYFAKRLTAISDRYSFVQKILDNQYLPGDALVTFPPFAPAEGRVVSSRESSNEAEITVESQGRGFLVATITPQKYWSATVDGAVVPLQPANVGFQGVEVPAGRHVVRMSYRNPLIAIGAGISVTALLALSAWAVLDARRRRALAPA